MSKMEQLASIFGKKLEEEFIIKYPFCKDYVDELKGKFTNEGLEIIGLMPHEEITVLNLLLTDKATILEE